MLSLLFVISRHPECFLDEGLEFGWHLLQNHLLEFFGRHHNLFTLLRVVILDRACVADFLKHILKSVCKLLQFFSAGCSLRSSLLQLSESVLVTAIVELEQDVRLSVLSSDN